MVVYFGLAFTVEGLRVAVCLDWCVTHADGRVGRVGRLLNAPPLIFVGMMSYSLYLWQQPFLNRGSSSVASSFPLNIVLAVGAALASYDVIERPSVRLRRRIETHLHARAARANPPEIEVAAFAGTTISARRR